MKNTVGKCSAVLVLGMMCVSTPTLSQIRTISTSEAIQPIEPKPSSAEFQPVDESLEELITDSELVAEAGGRSIAKARPGGKTSKSVSTRSDKRMAKAMGYINSRRYLDAAHLLFQMSRSPQYERESAQLKYILGLSLSELRLNQTAAFVFFDVIRKEGRVNAQNKYVRQSLEKLAIAADNLESDVLLKYAIKQINEENFPATSRDMLYYRTGELKYSEKDFQEAARQFGRVRPGSLFYARARYKMALSFVEAGELEKGETAFAELAEGSTEGGVTNKNRVNALMGKARVLYQKKDFERAIEAYRGIPRDTEQWHASLFESSWAMLRDGRFRSALSNFHSLHSPYYEDFYQPESLLLRAIVYLYICRHDEMEKVLDLFARIYSPVRADIKKMLLNITEPEFFYRELAKIQENFEALKADKEARQGLKIPFIVARQILQEGDVKKTFSYLAKLKEEKKRIEGMPVKWRNTSVGQYARKIVDKRIEVTHVLAGKQIRRHLIILANDLRKFFEQDGLLRFERLSSKRESLRKEIAGKDLASQELENSTERSYLIQNGYEYWPFQGEYWLDEIGNYYYVGVRACE